MPPPPLVLLLLSVCIWVWVLIFLTLIIVDWTVSIEPDESNVWEASVPTSVACWLLVELLVSLKTFWPASNFGVVISLGLGIKKDPLTDPNVSVLKFRLVIVAWALEVCPTNLRPFSTYP